MWCIMTYYEFTHKLQIGDLLRTNLGHIGVVRTIYSDCYIVIICADGSRISGLYPDFSFNIKV